MAALQVVVMRHETHHRIAQQSDESIVFCGAIVEFRVVLHMARDHSGALVHQLVQLRPAARIICQDPSFSRQCGIAGIKVNHRLGHEIAQPQRCAKAGATAFRDVDIDDPGHGTSVSLAGGAALRLVKGLQRFG